jgi:hypothetical protein
MHVIKTLSVAGLFALSSVALADLPEQFETVEELMYAHQDYDPAYNSLEILDADEPHYRLSKIVFKNDLNEVVYYENWRAAAYGIYNVFAHTPIESVTVSAIPYQIPGFQRADEGMLLNDREVTIQINREQALDVISSLIDVDSLTDVKTQTEYGFQWSDDYIDVYYEDRSPGLNALISELKPYCVNNCQ